MTEFLTIIVSAAVGAMWQTRLEARRFIHEKIFESRKRLYTNAWQITGQLPLAALPPRLTS
jgi:hypothetical protein